MESILTHEFHRGYGPGSCFLYAFAAPRTIPRSAESFSSAFSSALSGNFGGKKTWLMINSKFLELIRPTQKSIYSLSPALRKISPKPKDEIQTYCF